MTEKLTSDQEMPLVAHLSELRDRLLRCVVAVLLIFIGLFYFAQDIYALVAAPLRAYLPEGATMIATGVASPFLTPFKLTLVISLFLAMPVVLQQIWGFIAPGLYQHEKRIAVPLLISSILLFYAGMAFAYFVVFPIMFGFFARESCGFCTPCRVGTALLKQTMDKLAAGKGSAYDMDIMKQLMQLENTKDGNHWELGPT